MRPDRGRRVVTVTLMTVLAAAPLAACTSSPTTPTATSAGPMMTRIDGGPQATSGPPQPVPDATTPVPTTATASGRDPVSRWALATARLGTARSSTYTVVGTLDYSDGAVTYTRRFTVDAKSHRLAVHGSVRGGPDSADFDVVVAPSGAFARDSSTSPWKRATAWQLAMVGVGRDAADITAVPEPLRTFVAQSDLGAGEVSGTVDAAEGLRAAALGPFLVEDRELASSLGGSVYTVITVDQDGRLVKAAIDGEKSTGYGDTTVYGGSKRMPERDLIQIYFLLDVEVTVDSVDEPVKVYVPTASELQS